MLRFNGKVLDGPFMDDRGKLVNYGDWLIFTSSSYSSWMLAQYTINGFEQNLFEEHVVYSNVYKGSILRIEKELLEMYTIILEYFAVYKAKVGNAFKKPESFYALNLVLLLKKSLVQHNLLDKSQVFIEMFNRQLVLGDYVYYREADGLHTGIIVGEKEILTDYLQVKSHDLVYKIDKCDLTEIEKLRMLKFQHYVNAKIYQQDLRPGNLYMGGTSLYLYLGDVDCMFSNSANKTSSMFSKKGLWFRIVTNTEKIRGMIDRIDDISKLIGYMGDTLSGEIKKHTKNIQIQKKSSVDTLDCSNITSLTNFTCFRTATNRKKLNFIANLGLTDSLVFDYLVVLKYRTNRLSFEFYLK